MGRATAIGTVSPVQISIDVHCTPTKVFSVATPAQPEPLTVKERNQLSALRSVVSRIFASWNQIAGWLRRLATLRRAA
jgi:hypothetical protein